MFTKRCIIIVSLIFLLVNSNVFSTGTTGKIAGKIIDAKTKNPLLGANVFLVGTKMGGATNEDGDYFIIRIPPGTYTLEISYIGYQPVIIQNVKVSIDKTTKINMEMQEIVLETEAVVVTAKRSLVKTDLTSTEAVISSERIASLPVERFDEIVNLQAGVTNGHFRGGRIAEVAFMIDGISVNDVYSGSYALEVENSSINEIQVISGTFNAEYGQAMSGVVNIVTKEGGDKYTGEIESYIGNYYSNNRKIFRNLDVFNPISNFQGNLSGPVPFINDKMTFYLNSRYYNSDGYIFGRHVFDPTDNSDFTASDDNNWIIESKGKTYNFSEETAARLIREAEFVSMNPSKRYTAELKLTYTLNPNIKINYLGLYQKEKNKVQEHNGFKHNFMLNPYGIYNTEKTGNSNSVILSHMLNKSVFYTLKFANFVNNYEQYVYEDIYDTRYAPTIRLRDAGANAFYSGGQQMWHFNRSTETQSIKLDLVNQITNTHQIKLGFEARRHVLKLHEYEILTEGSRRIPPITAFNNNQYTKKPVEGSLYIQDKMEFEEMIVNAGFRYDYFSPKSDVPTDFSQPGAGPRTPAKSSNQLSPRFGIAYTISESGVIHVSYGHFFQIPSYRYLYLNPEFDILPLQSVPSPPPVEMLNTVGNSSLKPQKTVIYELGLQKGLTDNIGLTLTTYYKDIRNLLGTEVHYTLQGIRYGRYINRDYGNVKGVTLAFEKRHTNNVSATIDYTLQFAKGNASDPNTAFLDQQTDPPKQTVKQLVPLNWDRTHQINLTVTFGNLKDYAVSFIGRLGTGMPYTPSFQNIQTSVENSDRKPTIFSVDLYAYKDFRFADLNYKLYFRGYNILNRLNEVDVFSDTGRAGYSLAPVYSGGLRPRGVNTLTDYYIRPDFYSEPRKIQIGIKVSF